MGKVIKTKGSDSLSSKRERETDNRSKGGKRFYDRNSDAAHFLPWPENLKGNHLRQYPGRDSVWCYTNHPDVRKRLRGRKGGSRRARSWLERGGRARLRSNIHRTGEGREGLAEQNPKYGEETGRQRRHSHKGGGKKVKTLSIKM